MSAGATNSPRFSRIPELDGLRGFAILMVIACHYLAIDITDSEILRPFAWIWALSWSGVDLFFVLSGFLIGGILLDERQSEGFFKVFFLRRICRIFPLYFVYISLFFVILWLAPIFETERPFAYCFERVLPSWSYFLFLQNFFVAKMSCVDNEWMRPTWSLAVEEQFYLTLPFLIRFAPRRVLLSILLGVALMSPVFRWLMYVFYSAGEIGAYVLLPCRADTLIAGVLCAYAMRSDTLRRYLTASNLRVVGTVLFAVLGYLWMTASWQISFEMVTWGYSLLAMFYAYMLLVVVTLPKHFLSRLMRLSLLQKLGRISFGVYLIHAPMNSVWHNLLLGRDIYIQNFTDLFATIAAGASTLFLAWCSWKFFEKPIVDFGHRFKYTRAATEPMVAAQNISL